MIYLVKQSAVVRLAEQRHPTALAILAAIIWHEMAHLDGATETAAQRREVELWTRMIRDQLVDPATGLRYLALLKDRPHPTPALSLLAGDPDNLLAR